VGETGGSQPGTARTPQERQGELEGQLDESLRTFDEMLLREQQVLAERREASGDSPQGSPAGAGGAADGSRPFGEGGVGAATTGGDPEGGAAQSGGAAGGATAGSRGTITPSGIPDGGDDDIVARQLREAARAEKDPALRRKLWEEYCAYKESTSGKRCDGDWASSPESGQSR
jgi:hypothetical protein